MDRQISSEEKARMRRHLWLKITIGGAVAVACVFAVATLLSSSVMRSKLAIATVSRGDVMTTIPAGGKVVPMTEQTITSPITTRIVEVYRSPGDKVETGTPLLRLDLQDAENEISKLRDELDKSRLALKQTSLNNHTALTSLDMQIKVKEMQVNRLTVDLRNEERLDSLGSGTGDRVNEARFALNTAKIELDQLRTQQANERLVKQAEEERMQLDIDILERNLSRQLATLEDARVKSPAAATLTSIVNNVGRQVNQGEKLASIADLSHFKIEATIADSRALDVTPGGRAIIKIGRNRLAGNIVEVSPVSSEGTMSFSVLPDDDSSTSLRPGTTADVLVMKEIHSDVMRIPVAAYYSRGPGKYELFVVSDGNRIERRQVTLGGTDGEYVEVIDGVQPDDEVVISDMTAFKGKSYKLK
ncbi:MAG: efflux RND transporter periplasmic adaptor subunit [Lachnoclostridium sp.]|nr:efflux RND transporter periplasmic adaptor subunit [Lachnoclostridium sp.]